MSSNRRQRAFNIRERAAGIARDRDHPEHVDNGDESRYRKDGRGSDFTHIASYTKGLPHDRQTGVILNDDHFKRFVRAINTGDEDDIRRIPLGPQGVSRNQRFQSGIARGGGQVRIADVRAWESMAAGNAFDLQGPDAQAVTMPPAPALESDELVAEMTENYWMALLRDVRFTDFDDDNNVGRAVRSLNQTTWVRNAEDPPQGLSSDERKRLRGPFNRRTVFRGTTEGDNQGPYISQFLLAGTDGIGGINEPENGIIQYGAMRMDQRVRVAQPRVDYMTTWEAFLDVQNGADVRGRERYVDGRPYRFITTPRDLATYVHYDALYQAYLNACIMLLNMDEVPYDKALPFIGDDDRDKQQGFALFGPPHILTLVTEVATRALKAVRFQKFNTHRRLRPEAVAGLIERFHNDRDSSLFAGVEHLYSAMDKDLLRRVANENERQNENIEDFGNPRSRDFSPEGGRSGETRLLPMAFAEGSPMHPSYGAGHGTVAGACVTILKAFFDHEATLPYAFQPSDNGERLERVQRFEGRLTVEGELNKLCSNISIGRNWAGVHYFSDYRESIELGETVAIGLLREQKLTYGEKFRLTVPKFDGKIVRI